MPRPRKVMTLPRGVRERLDAFIIEKGFSGYAELAEWLAAGGHDIDPSTLARHGRDLRRRIERIRHATESAEALVAASPDNTLAMADASLRMAQEQIYTVLYHAEGGNLKEAAAAARALAEAAASEARKLGLSGNVAAALRSAVEGAGG